jgi:hypothetical protein
MWQYSWTTVLLLHCGLAILHGARLALPAKSGSRMKIQDWCYQGLIVSAARIRRIVDAEIAGREPRWSAGPAPVGQARQSFVGVAAATVSGRQVVVGGALIAAARNVIAQCRAGSPAIVEGQAAEGRW